MWISIRQQFRLLKNLFRLFQALSQCPQWREFLPLIDWHAGENAQCSAVSWQ
jgi:hypothetical protein